MRVFGQKTGIYGLCLGCKKNAYMYNRYKNGGGGREMYITLSAVVIKSMRKPYHILKYCTSGG
jgi:hypothetical protein